jgi:hypothetical protein
MAEDKALSNLLMDRAYPLGNSEDDFLRRALHVKIGNKITEPLPMGGLLSGVQYDAIKVVYTSSTSETYTYYSGGLLGVLQTTILITYTDSTKNNLVSVERI